MNSIHLSLKGFKCHEDTVFDLNNITLLTGANSSGKSSVVQALLILHSLAHDRNMTMEEVLNNEKNALSLGDVFDILYQQTADKATIETDRMTVSLFSDGIVGVMGTDEALESKMLFLSAERDGPRNEVKKNSSPESNCGCHGQFTAEVIDSNQLTTIASDRTLDGQAVKLPVALDQWTDLIFPGTSIRIKTNGDYLQAIIRSSHSSISSKAPNVGFGISYALPIIVSGLLADKGDWLVIENPEAHLHAKAQSNMGYFLAQMAAAGVRVVVETHSEHVVNGIRRFSITTKRLSPKEATIYFLPEGEKANPIEISFDNEGNLSDFPVDFFDQSRQDLLAIIAANEE